MLNAISLFIRPTLKIVSIEDTQEIRLPHQNWEMMVTRQGLGTGAGAVGEAGIGSISMFDLLRAALRQRPDFIIVGEIRGEEAYALFQAMATGHLGLTTIHAEHVQGVLHRLTTKPMNIPHTQVENLNAISIVRQTSCKQRLPKKNNKRFRNGRLGQRKKRLQNPRDIQMGCRKRHLSLK